MKAGWIYHHANRVDHDEFQELKKHVYERIFFEDSLISMKS